ncbi:HAMP domain-containing sensor histidine kinase [Streptomyces abikoensis]|uniref:HAMP domain-containing sensor histidine kinase n=1 Tax=Streptomyces abikoensis TaxID=97398 RepID=UPI0033CE8BC4
MLVGAGLFEGLASLPAVAANVAALRGLFTSEKVWGLPKEHCVVVRDPHVAREVSQTVRQAAREAVDTLIFYYAGHGLIDPVTGELHLALRNSHAQEVYDTAVPYEWIKRPLAASRAKRRIVLLDCCYSGRMLGAMSDGLGLAEIDRTYLLAAAAENAIALAPPGELYTAFTGELVALLQSGVPGAGDLLALNDIYEAMRSSLHAAGRPEPHCRDRNSLGAVPLIPNRAYRTLTPCTTAVVAGPADAPIRRIIADMSRELRTPLTSVSAVTGYLEEEADYIDPMLAPAVHLVISETRRLNDLVETMLELAEFDAGTAQLIAEDVEITKQIEACVNTRGWLDAVTLDTRRPIHARLDPRRLDLILANLIGNALIHGGSSVTVTADSRDAPDAEDGNAHPSPPLEFTIKVTDSGRGIPENALPFVFDRFFKASSSRPRSARSGLGLSIAQENAHLMGGGIQAANRAEGGTEFILQLPHGNPKGLAGRAVRLSGEAPVLSESPESGNRKIPPLPE